jgi:hypothetical protein
LQNYSVDVILDELSTIGFCYYCNMLHELVVNWTHNYVQDDVLICLLFEQTFNFNVLRFKLFFKKSNYGYWLLHNLISNPKFCMLVHFPLSQNVEFVVRTFYDYVLTLITESYKTCLYDYQTFLIKI